MWRQLRNLENVTLVVRWREHFWGFGAIFLVAELPQKIGCLNAQEFIRFLSTGVVSASSHALWRVLSNEVIWVLGHCWVDIPHIYTSEWDSLFSQSFLPSTVTVTPSDLDYVNRSASLQQFWLMHTSTVASTIFRIRTTGYMHTRQSPYEIVEDCSDEGASLLCQGPRRRREETAWKRRRIKKSLVVVMFLVRVMTCIVFYQLFWNWIGVVRFVPHEVWSGKGFVTWHFFYGYF